MSITDGFSPYVTGEGTMDIAAIEAWSAMIAGVNAEWGITNPFSLYERLIDRLADPRFDICPLGDLMAAGDPARVRISLRHDLDSNLLPAWRAASLLRSRGMVGSFYPLHSSQYWGEFRDGVFLRQPGLAEAIGRIAREGQEIGLHIDPLHFYFAHGVDGTAALLAELAHLRALVGEVRGAVAHNSAPVYGAENFEIFEGLALGGRRSLEWRGKVAPLQTVSLAECGLSYEGNHAAPPDAADKANLAGYLANVPPDALRRADWQALYLLHNPVFSRRNDASLWLIGRDLWSVAVHRPQKRLLANIDTASAFNWLDRLDAGSRVVIVLHPEYLGGADA